MYRSRDVGECARDVISIAIISEVKIRDVKYTAKYTDETRSKTSSSIKLHHSVHDPCSQTDLVDFYWRDVRDSARISRFRMDKIIISNYRNRQECAGELRYVITSCFTREQILTLPRRATLRFYRIGNRTSKCVSRLRMPDNRFECVQLQKRIIYKDA